ncbi:MAG: hypothetical protein VB035_04000 [Candidatus Fimivivens sp.]|nr:hypothetical protein [Candidatus Fimivivens sp.]
MVKIKIFEVNAYEGCKPNLEKRTVAPMEAFITQIGYENIMNIVTVSTGASNLCYYTIFYEDGLPFTPYVEEEPKKKGIFG